MPLDLDSTNPMYLLGRVVAVIDLLTPRNLPRIAETGILDTLLARPTTGLGLLSRKLGARMRHDDIESILSVLPEGGLPAGPIAVEDQGPFWMGYYHQREQGRRDVAITAKFTPEVIRRVGETLFGTDHWQAEMARALGLSDRSRIAAWITGNGEKRRRIPPGVCRDLMAMLRHKSSLAKALADDIDAVANDMDDGAGGDEP